MAARQQETPVWERSKENTAPLERGRNIEVLERAQQENTTSKMDLERMRLHYESLVQPTEGGGSTHNKSKKDSSSTADPLIHWLSYIKFHQDSFPSDTHGQFLLLERCVRALLASPHDEYLSDVRFVRVCCLYAEKTERAAEIFPYLYQQRVGTTVALFWAAWAFVAEKQQDYALAEKIFEKGLRKQALPASYLLQRQKQFQRRMSRLWLNSTMTQGGEEDDSDDDGGAARRGALGALSQDAIRRNDRRVHSTAPSSSSRLSTFTDRSARPRQENTGNRSGTGFSIFVEGGGAPGGADALLTDSFTGSSRRQLEREEDRLKENTLQAERWNQRGGLSTVSDQPARPPAPFAVYVDKDCEAQHEREREEELRNIDIHRHHRDERTFRERKDGGVAEKLSHDPLRYLKDPSQLEADQAAAAKVETKSRPRQDKPKASSRGFNQRLLRDASGKEQSFEEARMAASYYTIAGPSTDVNFLVSTIKPLDTSLMSIDEDDISDDVDMDAVDPPPPRKVPPRGLSVRVNLLANRSFDAPTPRNASTASSTVDEAAAVGVASGREEQTINTQLALRELSMMFSSPAMGLNDSGYLQPERVGGLGHILNQSGVSEAAASDQDPATTDNILAEVSAMADGDTATFSMVAALEGDWQDDNNENDAAEEPNPHRRSSATTPDFDETALRPLNNLGNRRGASVAPLETVTAPSSGPGFAIFQDEAPVPSAPPSPPHQPASTFAIYQDEEPAAEDASVGDTASFSIFEDSLMPGAASAPLSSSRPQHGPNTVNGRMSHLESTSRPPAFGDISHIAPVEDDGTIDISVRDAIEYATLHKKDIRSAVERLKHSSMGYRRNQPSLLQVLGNKGTVHDLPTHVVPRILKQPDIPPGTELKVDRSSATIKCELGRGVYGVVVLVEGQSPDNAIAVKAQSPAACLAWEYEILAKLEERVDASASDGLPFPRALSYLSMADGAILGMTAASSINLIDLVNLYSLQGIKVPNVVTLHYTARMLQHLELLHWRGKILHCDTKPDNWVLTRSECVGGVAMDGSDLMLVDFGRAIDLTTAAKEGTEPMDTLFVGPATHKEMMCVSMRQGLPWSFDIDTFGVCAAAHVLLFGQHLELAKAEDGLWMPRNKLSHPICSDLFSTLLNLDGQVAIGSRPHSLRQLRSRLEAHIRADQLQAALAQQSTLFSRI